MPQQISETRFSHRGVDVTVIQRYRPDGLVCLLGDTPEGRQQAQNLALDYFDCGPSTTSIRTSRPRPKELLVELDVDLSADRRVLRDLRLLNVANRLSALFGGGAPGESLGEGDAVPVVLEDVDGEPALWPPVSPAGNFLRALGHLVGFGADFVCWGAQALGRATLSLWRRCQSEANQ